MRPTTVMPSAARLTSSLRDIGYGFGSALADLVDNSIAAGADKIDVEVCFHGEGSYVLVADNGAGMTADSLIEAMRFGTRRDYKSGELGRYGLGLKTASLSQARRLWVISRSAPSRPVIRACVLDMGHVERTDRWEVLTPDPALLAPELRRRLAGGPGTIVIWDHLDRLRSYANPSGAWAERSVERAIDEGRQHLAMVFHRFLAGEVPARPALEIQINGSKLQPWDPFARKEPATRALPRQLFPVRRGDAAFEVAWSPFILPSREEFSSPEAFDHAAGSKRWNRQQGIYAYRNNRLIQAGGWAGLRTLDEHTKLARVAVDFHSDADEVFNVDVAKQRITLPQDLAGLLERPTAQLAHSAQAAYRSAAAQSAADDSAVTRPDRKGGAALALLAAAVEIGEEDVFDRILNELRKSSPAAAEILGFASER